MENLAIGFSKKMFSFTEMQNIFGNYQMCKI